MPNPGFRTTRLSEGYDRSEVDRFLRRIDDIEAGTMPRPSDLIAFMTSVTFPSTILGSGYNMEDVDDHIDALIDEARAAGASTVGGQPLTGAQVDTLRTLIRRTAAAPRGRRLARAGRLVEGYDVDEVDDLIERLDSPDSTIDLRTVSFEGRRHGYEMSDVELFLDDVRPLFGADLTGR